jgi:two-component system sensor histidine kinase/response regulator
MPTHATANELRAENAALRQHCAQLETRMAEIERQQGALDRFSQLFHANPDAILITEIADGRILDVNEAAIQLIGSSRAELIGRTTLELGFFPNRATRTARIQQVLGGDRSADYELTFTRKDGGVIYASTTSQVMEIGGAPRLVTIARDVTVARELERVLRASEERYRLLAENISDVIWMLDLRTNRFTYISPSVEKLYGYTVEEAMQLTFIDMLTAAALHTVTTAIAEVLQSTHTGTPIDRRRMELEQIRKDGSTVCTEIMVSAMFNQDDGELIGALGVTRDITERRTQEAAIREANATLEQRVAERTQQLQTANLALEKAALAKDEFLATMSHELRTPLVGVLNMAEALQTGVYGMPSESMMRGLKTIERSGHHLLKLINDMLDLSRIELGRLELREDLFAVNDVVPNLGADGGGDRRQTEHQPRSRCAAYGSLDDRRLPARAADVGQPAGQRRQIHACRRHSRAEHRRRHRKQDHPFHRLGHRHRHRRRYAAARFRAVHPERQPTGAPLWRRGHGIGTGEKDG